MLAKELTLPESHSHHLVSRPCRPFGSTGTISSGKLTCVTAFQGEKRGWRAQI